MVGGPGGGGRRKEDGGEEERSRGEGKRGESKEKHKSQSPEPLDAESGGWMRAIGAVTQAARCPVSLATVLGQRTGSEQNKEGLWSSTEGRAASEHPEQEGKAVTWAGTKHKGSVIGGSSPKRQTHAPGALDTEEGRGPV